MNVFKFNILVEVKDSTNQISDEIKRIYASKSNQSRTYEDYVKKKWENINKENIVTLYAKDAILTYVNKSKTTYFIIDVDANDAVDHCSVEVIVLSEMDDIKDAFNIVYKDLNKKLKKEFKMSLIDDQAFLYIYDGEDIVAAHVMIKAKVVSFSGFRKIEIIRSCIFSFLAIVLLIIVGISKNADMNDILVSLAASSIFFVITEFLVKISFSKIVEIKNFTNWLKTEERTEARTEVNGKQNSILENPEF